MRQWLGNGGPSLPSIAISPNEPIEQNIPSLLHRIQTSAIPNDVRDALTKLCEIPDISKRLNPNACSLLLAAARASPPDPIAQRKVMEILGMVLNDVTDAETTERYLSHLLSSENRCVATILSVLRDGDFWGRYFAVQCLGKLSARDRGRVQSQLLESPNGVGDLGETLQDTSNEGIMRYEGLVLLSTLTVENEEVNKILAFQGCFDRMFEIVRDENANTLPVVDALKVMQNMLWRSPSIQKYFLEMNSLAFLAPLVLILPEKPSTITNSMLVVVLGILKELCTVTGVSDKLRTMLVRTNVVNGVMVLVAHAVVSAEVHTEAIEILTLVCDGSTSLSEAFVAARCDDSSSIFCALIAYALQDPTSTARQRNALLLLVTLLQTVPSLCLDVARSISCKRSPKVQYPSAHLIAFCMLQTKSPTNLSILHAAYLFQTLLSHKDAREVLATLPWEEATLFTKVSRHVVATWGGQNQQDKPTLACLARVLMSWMRDFPKAVAIFLHDPYFLMFFYDTAWKESVDPMLRFLSATLVATVCANCPVELPKTARITRTSLLESWCSRIGIHKLTLWAEDAAATDEWGAAPARCVCSSPPTLLDKDLIAHIAHTREHLAEVLLEEFKGLAAHAVDTGSSQPLPENKHSMLSDITSFQEAEMKRLKAKHGEVMKPLHALQQQRAAESKNNAEEAELRTALAENEKQVAFLMEAQKGLDTKNVSLVVELQQEAAVLRDIALAKQEQLVEMGNSIQSLKESIPERQELLRRVTELASSCGPSTDRDHSSENVTPRDVVALESELARVLKECAQLREEKMRMQRDMEDMLVLIGELEECVNAK